MGGHVLKRSAQKLQFDVRIICRSTLLLLLLILLLLLARGTISLRRLNRRNNWWLHRHPHRCRCE